MRRFLRVGLAAVVLCVSLGYSAASASANVVTVYPNSSFSYSGYGGDYEGHCTTVTTDGDLTHLSCVGTIVSGTKVSKLTSLSGGNEHGVVTPSGKVSFVIIQ